MNAKKIFFLIAVATLLAACKKTYNCKCTSVSQPPPGSAAPAMSSTSTMSAEKKKKDAEAWCEAFESHGTSGSFTYSTTCELQ